MLSPKRRIWLLVIVSAAAIVGLCFVGPIAQDPGYHHFADNRSLGGISHFWNVASNLPFLLAGIFGLWRAGRLLDPKCRRGYLVLCVGICLVCFGSAYYHLDPSNYALLWDRLPMTVVFMALLALLLGERVIEEHQPVVLWILVAAGICAALYWSWTESQGRGDLRPYAVVQFLPLLLIPLILVLFPATYIRGSLLVWAFVLYLLAKVFEHFDRAIYDATGLLSGHTVKHVTAALAALCIIAAVCVRGGPAPCGRPAAPANGRARRPPRV